MPMPDLTAVYYTAGEIPDQFAQVTRDQLLRALGDTPLISVSLNQPLNFGSENYVHTGTRSQYSIYKQVLVGAIAAKTPYIACCEDDVLYSPKHFEFRPQTGHWGYNMNPWSLFTWGDPIYSYKAPGGRRNLNALICERELLISHLEERFDKWPDPDKIDIRIFGEPGKYDNQLGTTPHPSEDFYTNPPNIVFSHQTNLQFAGLGTRKRVGQIRATSIPYWGEAKDVRAMYE